MPRVLVLWEDQDLWCNHSSLHPPTHPHTTPKINTHRRAKIKATSEESFQSYAQCLQTTGNDLRKCAKLHDELLQAFEGAAKQ